MFIVFLCYLGMNTIQAQWYSLLCLCLVHKAMSAFMFFSIFFPLIFEEAISLDVKSAGNFSFSVTNIVHLVVCLIMQILSNLYKDIDFGWGLSLFVSISFTLQYSKIIEIHVFVNDKYLFCMFDMFICTQWLQSTRIL